MPARETNVSIEDFFARIKEYLTPEQVEFVHKAYDVAAKAHANQIRKSGEPYIIHPTGVAAILADLHMDELTLAAAFLQSNRPVIHFINIGQLAAQYGIAADTPPQG